jgi:hypothetical protein
MHQIEINSHHLNMGNDLKSDSHMHSIIITNVCIKSSKTHFALGGGEVEGGKEGIIMFLELS